LSFAARGAADRRLRRLIRSSLGEELVKSRKGLVQIVTAYCTAAPEK
jgi:hypothetical protein